MLYNNALHCTKKTKDYVKLRAYIEGKTMVEYVEELIAKDMKKHNKVK